MSRRLTALVIGNADYADVGKLKNLVNDAKGISSKLTECGFTVGARLNCSHQEWDLRAFALLWNLQIRPNPGFRCGIGGR